MRQYEEIWKKLKELPPEVASSSGIPITAPRYWHRRIIKAVTKEKWMDEGYKIWLSYTMEGKVAVLHHRRNNAILTFTLSFTLTVVDL